MNLEILELFYEKALNALQGRLVSQLRANRNTDGAKLKRYELALEKGYLKATHSAIRLLKQEYKAYIRSITR